MKFEQRMRELAKDAQGFPWQARRDQVLYIHDSPKKDEYDYICTDVIGGEDDNGTAKHIAFNDPTTALLVADLIAAAREVYDCHCDPYPGNDDVLVERAGLDRLGLAIAALDAALDAHHARGNK